MDHPSKAQLCNVVSRFFYAPGWKAMTEQVSDNCHQCAALRILPKVLTQDKIEQIPGFGSNFAADVIERSSQKILIVKEKLSQFLSATSIA